MDKPVVDHTGLTGRYDFTLNWTPDDSQFIQMEFQDVPHHKRELEPELTGTEPQRRLPTIPTRRPLSPPPCRSNSA